MLKLMYKKILAILRSIFWFIFDLWLECHGTEARPSTDSKNEFIFKIWKGLYRRNYKEVKMSPYSLRKNLGLAC